MAKGRRRFSPGIVKGVPRRCGYGCPQVLLCGAMRGAEPFPTSFWLVCPHLLRAAGRMESENGVALMESALRLAPNGREQWLSYHASHALLRLSLLSYAKKKYLRERRPGLYRALCSGGVGGIDYSGGEPYVKCLHLQLASYLATGRHPASAWLEERVRGWECDTGICAKYS